MWRARPDLTSPPSRRQRDGNSDRRRPGSVPRMNPDGVRVSCTQRRDVRARQRVTYPRVPESCEVRACRDVEVEGHLIDAGLKPNGSRRSARSNEAAIPGYDGPEAGRWRPRVALVALIALRSLGPRRPSRPRRARVTLQPLRSRRPLRTCGSGRPLRTCGSLASRWSRIPPVRLRIPPICDSGRRTNSHIPC